MRRKSGVSGQIISELASMRRLTTPGTDMFPGRPKKLFDAIVRGIGAGRPCVNGDRSVGSMSGSGERPVVYFLSLPAGTGASMG